MNLVFKQKSKSPDTRKLAKFEEDHVGHSDMIDPIHPQTFEKPN